MALHAELFEAVIGGASNSPTETRPLTTRRYVGHSAVHVKASPPVRQSRAAAMFARLILKPGGSQGGSHTSCSHSTSPGVTGF
jgi:hypothetical protein